MTNEEFERAEVIKSHISQNKYLLSHLKISNKQPKAFIEYTIENECTTSISVPDNLFETLKPLLVKHYETEIEELEVEFQYLASQEKAVRIERARIVDAVDNLNKNTIGNNEYQILTRADLFMILYKTENKQQ
jgi:hypothetical protein